MSQLTKFASLVVLSTALSAAGCMAKTTASEDTGAPLDEAKQASQTEEMDSADQESSALPATGVSSENSGSADPGSADAGSTSAGGEESAGEQPDASRFWGGGWGWHGGFRPWGWGGGFRPWGWGGFRPWGFRPWGWGGGCGAGFCGGW